MPRALPLRSRNRVPAQAPAVEFQHALVALWLAAARKICRYDGATRRGEWHWKTGRPVHRLRGQVLGLLSFGAIARLVAERARAFGVEVWAHDPFVDESEICAARVRPVSFDDLVEGADHLVVQAPLTPQTHHTFDRATLRRMKPTAVLVNTARGPIVEDAALYEALTGGWIAGAALDDIEEEPAKQRDWRPSNPLFELPNVVVTPHAAYYSEEAIGTVRTIAAEEAVRVLTGEPARYPVNEPAAGSHRAEGA
ncbi:NAD(P)-dependent oxidoreductase [Streptomyces anthocyanicus]|uniref:NAD(P)-dependent oxidoreductase n=1 Tax=Streptomyces anthocyanicus TaxID=68174 RepID=UPI001FEC823C|nr:NAD(P)-dependent oxidoreductase [Streptomyces anthocyanicus]